MTDIGDMIERGSEGPEWYQYPQDNAFQRLLYRNQELAAEVGRLQEELLAANAELGGRDIAAGRTVSYDHMKELTALRAEVERLQAELREHCELAKSTNAEHADVEAAWRAEVERLQERFDAVRDAAHAEAKRVFPATVIESHIGGELHADDLCSMLAAEVERLREEVAFWRDRMRIVSPKMDGQHAWRLANEWPPLVGPDADAAVRHAMDAIRTQPLPALPVEEEQ